MCVVMVNLSGSGWIKEDVLGLHDLADCPAFVSRVFPALMIFSVRV